LRVHWTSIVHVCVWLVFVHGVEAVDGIVLHSVNVLDRGIKVGHSRVVCNAFAFACSIGLVLILVLILILAQKWLNWSIAVGISVGLCT